MRAAVLALGALAACGGEATTTNVAIDPDPAFAAAFADFVAFTPGTALGEGSPRVAIVLEPGLPAEGYRLDAAGDVVTVHAPDVLGAQYGAAAALEAMGFRFRHPQDTLVPAAPAVGVIDGSVHQPEVRVRGLEPWTLHPIESHFALWAPNGDTTDAHRIIDWLVKNRGNFLQWAALDDIITDAGRHAEWADTTREIVDYAHARGVRVGLNIQLFGQSNLQQAFDLSDDRTGTVPIADEVRARLPLVTDGLPFDVYDLSFGEFFDAEPQHFIDSVNEVRGQLRTFAPSAEMHAVVHVGAKQRVSFMGNDLLYYFLVQYADPSIVPDIHTVMFYDLYEPAGGAYQHTDFSEHRAYLESRACSGKPVTYNPETAYWVAFNDSVPQYFPLYVRNRWLDVNQIDYDCAAPLDGHLLFSSGWEWGYWLHDVTALRDSYERTTSWQELVERELAPDLAAAAPVVEQLVDLQQRALMGQGLVAYLAGRDASIDLGRTLGIVSQPDRVRTIDLAGVSDWNAFRATVLAPLAAYAQNLDGLAASLDALALPATRWTAELRDGLAIDALRAHFVGAVYEATLYHLAGADGAAGTLVARAQALLDQARTVVARRHADLHDPHGRRLLERTTNATLYQYGYLFNADTLCYWDRELTEVQQMMGTTSLTPAGCLF